VLVVFHKRVFGRVFVCSGESSGNLLMLAFLSVVQLNAQYGFSTMGEYRKD